jgi:hypothetical protein
MGVAAAAASALAASGASGLRNRGLSRWTARTRDGAVVDMPDPDFLAGRLIHKLDTTEMGATKIR